jgi:predicted ATP-binding protein involved in virulence
LVGENGAGKTTVLHLFYYLLSGQWNTMAKYQFESVTITIDSKLNRPGFLGGSNL